MKALAAALLSSALLVSCGDRADLTVADGTGPNPDLPQPTKSLFPTVNVAEVDRWKDGETPNAGDGLTVAEFAGGLDHPRWLYILPNGDVLVAETNAPPRPEDDEGVKAWFMNFFMNKAGAATQSADRITLLRDADGDGAAETKSVFLEGLHSPFGMALVGNGFYVADTDAVLRFPYREGDTYISAEGEKTTDLPGGPLNHHWTKNIIASPDGARLFATVGSNSNVAENGMDAEDGRAAIWEIDLSTDEKRLFATGLRNPNGMDFEPSTGALWTVVNERDELGSDLVPDYLTSVQEGGFYGWPYSYYGDHVDDRVKPQKPALVEKAIVPDYALGPHTASLGLVFAEANGPTAAYSNGAFIGQHGSWNRKPPSGYRVIFVPFKNGEPAGAPAEVLTGFLNDNGKAQGRPVGVALQKDGSLLVADDVGNRIWRVTGASPVSQQQ